ncbi:MAG TPA: Asp-tRNA(Asn)/Glu-tRNA(Gln) amidotransferase subunit GatB [Candidatus Saccharimonadia bacterium]|nr:Asp-tRNA(Asn)/Glu-tRNA(Gln) amidotransferase subunit GatB [Candidatus Saccharimonadia bacterium]
MNPELRDQYEVVIGLETHVQLATKSKLFCSCNNDSRDADPNTNVCEVCMGFPGTLPVLNKRAVELALRLGVALNATYPERLHTKFDRKNYFYPDSPKGYQITQFDEPIVPNGYVDVPLDGETKRIGITRAHLEGDAGKLTHPDGKDYSLVDLNRAETPLLEIVSEPDMRSAAEAKAYAQELHNLARYAGASDANLYYGNMRFDVNVSVRKKGSDQFGTRTETKNLNSFRAIERTIEYETRRQIVLLEHGDRVRQETRGWNEAKQQTYAMRSKEDADEYRYFPEPDIPPIIITAQMVAAASHFDYLPKDLRTLLADAGIKAKEAEVIINEPELAAIWFEAHTQDPSQARFVFNWLTGPEISLREEADQPSKLTSKLLNQVGEMHTSGKLSSTNARELLARLRSQAGDPHQLAVKLGLLQESNEDELSAVVDAVLAQNPKAVEDYKAGNQRAFGALVGAAMKATAGKGNPPLITQLLKDRLG